MRFCKSFQYAFRGIVYCLNNERNMRIHAVVALFVFAFSFFYDLSRVEYAVLFLTFSAVISAELFNTVSEELSDMAAASFHPVVRIIKDMASGGVLVAAFFSVCVGVCLFWRPAVLGKIAHWYGERPAMIAATLLAAAAAAVFIILGPTGIRDYLRKKRIEK